MIYFICFILSAFCFLLYCLCATAKRADEELQLLMKARVLEEKKAPQNLL